ncbi:MAG: hypothetical protein KH230_09740 [Enterocloster asparagiformis]|nr:hypothetical protein [Enterocloster asparagiformis]
MDKQKLITVNLPSSIIKLVCRGWPEGHDNIKKQQSEACKRALYKALEKIYPNDELELRNIQLVFSEKMNTKNRSSVNLRITEEADAKLEEIRSYALLSKKNLAEILICQEVMP